jgi:transposase InsO family protein
MCEQSDSFGEERMDIHQNARLTLRSREALVLYVLQEGFTRKAAAAAFRVSAKTVTKWVGRFQREGLAGLRDRSSRPHRSPRRVLDALQQRVIELRRERKAAFWIARQTGLSTATVSRILRRARLSRWRDLNPPPPVVRYEHPHPGDLLHLDIKGLTRFAEVDRRGDGRLRGKRKHPGFLRAAHRHRRPLALGLHPDAARPEGRNDDRVPATGAWTSSPSGIVTIRALLTDNGSATAPTSSARSAPEMQLKHRRTRPYTPRTNGKAERFIQTALSEWAYAQHWDSSEQRDAQLQPWTDFYNHQRPHGSLDYKPPISRLRYDGTTS